MLPGYPAEEADFTVLAAPPGGVAAAIQAAHPLRVQHAVARLPVAVASLTGWSGRNQVK